jgi:pimeloyl-[acyl-carrier protein] methyl ester esterase
MISRLVLLPGMDGTGDLFADFATALPAEFEATIVRYPKNAAFTNDALSAIIEKAVPAGEPFVLLAESFSTPLAVEFAATNPDNLKGVILCAGFVSSPLQGWRRLTAPLLAPILLHLPLSTLACEKFLIGSRAPRPLLGSVRMAISSVRTKVLESRLRRVLTCDAGEALARIAVPILYIQALHDRLVPFRCLDEIRRIKPQTEMAVITGPHLILQREPQKAAAAVAQFIRKVSG